MQTHRIRLRPKVLGTTFYGLAAVWLVTFIFWISRFFIEQTSSKILEILFAGMFSAALAVAIIFFVFFRMFLERDSEFAPSVTVNFDTKTFRVRNKEHRFADVFVVEGGRAEMVFAVANIFKVEAPMASNG